MARALSKKLKNIAARLVGLGKETKQAVDPEPGRAACNDAAELIASGFFDDEVYTRSAGIAFKTPIEAAEHYLQVGERSGFKPHPGFDPVIYEALYPDLNGLPYAFILHYIRYGQYEGRVATKEAKVIRGNGNLNSAEVVEIVSSPFFDEEFYSKSAGATFISNEAAAEHYLSSGERKGFCPHKSFDPIVYRLSNPDLAEWPDSLLLHFIQHGRKEGRRATFDADDMLLEGKREYDPSRKTILVGVHDLSVTGAPILALNLIRRLARTANVICIAAHGGSMLEDFRAEVVVLAAPRDGWLHIGPEIVAKRLIGPLKERYLIEAAVVNSIEAAVFAVGSHLADLPVVSLVHEFADYVFPRWKVPTMMGYSQRVIFSSSLTERSMRDVRMVRRRLCNTVILPQGKSNLPIKDSTSEPAPDEAIERIRAEGRFIVVGSGHVHIRKGVDLFIAVASRVASIMGKNKVQFVWVGDGYVPEEPGDYSGWLKSQIERSDLAGAFAFMPALKLQALEALYGIAGAMFLSSRLDPFPNVAIDAFKAGLPVVCFDQASGIAEYLQRFPELSDLVVPFFAIEAAAEAVVKLATDTPMRKRVSRKLKELAEAEFDFDKYAGRISGFIEEAERAHKIELDDARMIQNSEFFKGRVSWLGKAPASRDRLIREYVRLEAAGAFPASPRPFPGFSPDIYAERTGLSGSQNAFAAWLREGRPDGPWKRDVFRLAGGDGKHNLRVALHVHLHYAELISDFIQRLNSNETLPDLYLSATSEEGASSLLDETTSYRGNVVVKLTPNVGRDIASMFTEFSDDLQAYDLVGHLHGKKSPHVPSALGGKDFVAAWREFLLENLVGGKIAALDAIACRFAGDERLGMVFPEDPFVCGWGKNKELADGLARRVGIDDPPLVIEFPVGNMYYFRPKALRPLFSAGFSYEDFPREPVPDDGTILHALERLTPLVCSSQGFEWLTTEVEGVTR